MAKAPVHVARPVFDHPLEIGTDLRARHKQQAIAGIYLDDGRSLLLSSLLAVDAA